MAVNESGWILEVFVSLYQGNDRVARVTLGFNSKASTKQS